MAIFRERSPDGTDLTCEGRQSIRTEENDGHNGNHQELRRVKIQHRTLYSFRLLHRMDVFGRSAAPAT